MRRILVTGGLGFIGSELVRHLADNYEIVVADALTYAADPRRLDGLEGPVRVERVDVAEPEFIKLVEEVRPDVIAHLAAETHVTRSENAPAVFARTNVEGTRRALEAAKRVGALLLHVSTDEVYGPIDKGAFGEDDKALAGAAATSPYAKSKAIADDIAVEAMGSQEVIVARPTNCYGPWQHPEKAVARWVARALDRRPLPVWGDGSQVRDWMFVDDACSALLALIEGSAQGVFNIGPESDEITNLDMAGLVADAAGGQPPVVLTAYDRPQHDRRYRVDASKLRRFGWEPRWSLSDGVARTVEWYRANQDWVHAHIAEAEELYVDDAPAG